MSTQSPSEITYGLERLAMYIQNKDKIVDIIWQEHQGKTLTYGNIYTQSEIENCHYNFEAASVDSLLSLFEIYEKECASILEKKLVFPAYDLCLKCSHTFNLLDARGAISVTERMTYILRIRKLAKSCAGLYLESINDV